VGETSVAGISRCDLLRWLFCLAAGPIPYAVESPAEPTRGSTDEKTRVPRHPPMRSTHMTQSTDQGTVWLTQDAFDKLHAELEDLKGPRRQEVIERISAARDEGDLKENAAKDEQGKIEARIRQLEDMLRRAEVGETPANDGVVEPGMVVTYRFVGDDETEKFLLGAREIKGDDDPLEVYSPQSAMGAAINGRSKGDTVTYTAPNGKELSIEIVDAVPYKA
jgi:transcription elongation factor GreA